MPENYKDENEFWFSKLFIILLFGVCAVYCTLFGLPDIEISDTVFVKTKEGKWLVSYAQNWRKADTLLEEHEPAFTNDAKLKKVVCFPSKRCKLYFDSSSKEEMRIRMDAYMPICTKIAQDLWGDTFEVSEIALIAGEEGDSHITYLFEAVPEE